MVTVPDCPEEHSANPAVTSAAVSTSAKQRPVVVPMHHVVMLVMSAVVGIVL
jgi:hypothetical protein